MSQKSLVEKLNAIIAQWKDIAARSESDIRPSTAAVAASYRGRARDIEEILQSESVDGEYDKRLEPHKLSECLDYVSTFEFVPVGSSVHMQVETLKLLVKISRDLENKL